MNEPLHTLIERLRSVLAVITVGMGCTGHPLITHLVSTLATKQGSCSLCLRTGGIHRTHSTGRRARRGRWVHGQGDAGVVITRNMVRMSANATRSDCSKPQHAAENLQTKRRSCHGSIRVDEQRKGRKVGGRSDCRILADPVHSCGTVTDFHRAFPVSSRSCSPLEPKTTVYTTRAQLGSEVVRRRMP